MQINNLDFITFKPNEKPFFKYDIDNVGKQPAKILSAKFGLSYDSIGGYIRLKDFPNIKFNNIILNRYATNTVPYTGKFTSDIILPKEGYNILKGGRIIPYFLGEIKYKNAVTGASRTYEFSFQFFPFDKTGAVQMLYNENTSDK